MAYTKFPKLRLIDDAKHNIDLERLKITPEHAIMYGYNYTSTPTPLLYIYISTYICLFRSEIYNTGMSTENDKKV